MQIKNKHLFKHKQKLKWFTVLRPQLSRHHQYAIVSGKSKQNYQVMLQQTMNRVW